jgi:sugar lactone lactonase YvrE
MMKKWFLVLVAVALLPSLALAQVWTYDSDFPAPANAPHAVVVDGAGKIWVGNYGYTDTFFVGTDTLPYKPLWVFNPDGTLHMKVETVTFDGVTDTIWNSCRGLAVDHDGNILFTNWYILYRINHQTGEVMNKVIPPDSASLTEAAADANGYIYVTNVVQSGRPLYIYDEDFELYGYVEEEGSNVTRTVCVNDDGTDVYCGRIYGGLHNNGVVLYHSDAGPDGDYAPVDTFQQLIWAQCMDFDNNGLLWVGSYWSIDASELGGWYGLDPTQGYGAVDMFGENGGEPTAGVTPVGGVYHAPRGAAWSADGKTMYTADFDGGVYKEWCNASPIGPGGTVIPLAVAERIPTPSLPPAAPASVFHLYQNYPNPFHSRTTIEFTLLKNGFVDLRVFDVTGRVVETLVNESMTAGDYNITFDSSKLPTGVYYYRMAFDGQAMTKKMLIVK